MSNDPSQSDEEFVGDESSDEFESENTLVFDAVEIPPPPSDESAEPEAEEADDDESAAAPAEDGDEADEDEPDNAVFDISELKPHSAETSPEDFGGPEDASEEQPLLVVSPSDEAESLPEGDAGEASDEAPARPRETPLRGAYEYLQIRTPIAEFESYARARTEALIRLGDSKDAEIAALAMNLGTEALKRVMGAIPKETL